MPSVCAFVLCGAILLCGCIPAPATPLLINDALETEKLAIGAFGSAEISIEEHSIRVRRVPGPSNAMGVRLTLGPQAPNGDFAALFSVQGEGIIALREQSNGQLRYVSGREGVLRISNEVEEVVLYSDDSMTLDIRIEPLLDCTMTREGPCFDFEDLQKIIFPNGPPTDRREHLLAILSWASNNADQATVATLNDAGKRFVMQYDAPQMFSLVYEKNLGGGYCGTHATFFANLLRAFGYDALVINYGLLDNDLTHVTNLVYDPFGDGRLYLLDPTFNAHLVDRETNDWLSFDQVISLPPERLRIASASLAERDFLFPQNAISIGYEACQPVEGTDVVACRRPNYGVADYLSAYATALASAGLPGDESGFLLLMRSRYFNTGVGGSDEARAAFARALQANGIRILAIQPGERESGLQ